MSKKQESDETGATYLFDDRIRQRATKQPEDGLAFTLLLKIVDPPLDLSLRLAGNWTMRWRLLYGG